MSKPHYKSQRGANIQHGMGRGGHCPTPALSLSVFLVHMHTHSLSSIVCLRMASFLDTETSSESESSLDDETRGQSQMTYNSSNEDDLSSELDVLKSLPRKPRKKRRRYGSGSAKEKLHPSNGRTINSTPKPRAPGKWNQPITPTTRKRLVSRAAVQQRSLHV